MAKGTKAVSKIKDLFSQEKIPMTINDVYLKTQLHPSEISMALCYLLKRNQVTRQLIDCPIKKSGRNQIYQYTYIN